MASGGTAWFKFATYNNNTLIWFKSCALVVTYEI